MTIAMDKEAVRTTFYEKVLEGLDEAAHRCFADFKLSDSPGATDADLPALFAAINEQIERICARLDVVLIDDLSELHETP
jgi:hypothetical protein